MMGWDPAENGWYASTPTEEDLLLARAERLQRDSNHPNLFETPDRWVGELAEMGFEAWLRSEGVEARRNGGVDQLPDFEIAGVGVGVKCRTVTGTFQPHYVVNVPDEHMARGERVFVFLAYEREPNRLLLLGGTAATRFKSKAKLVTADDQLHAAAQSPHRCWNIECTELSPPGEFVDYFKTRVAA